MTAAEIFAQREAIGHAFVALAAAFAVVMLGLAILEGR